MPLARTPDRSPALPRAVPFPIPYQGSKRRLAPAIAACFPPEPVRLFEPFCGSAAVALASVAWGRATEVHLNDANAPLMGLWRAIVDRPGELALAYRRMWEAQHGHERAYFDVVRRKFNRSHRPELLLFLLARCVKGAVRYNRAGEFNQSPDLRRRGTRPARMASHISAASSLFRDRTVLSAGDYRRALAAITSHDVAYLDPPYRGVSGAGDRRYRLGLTAEELVDSLDDLNGRGISYVLSYDGRTGSKSYGPPLPASLRLHRIEVAAGRSSQATLHGRSSVTYEALYVSPALVERWPERPPAPAIDGETDGPSLLVATGG